MVKPVHKSPTPIMSRNCSTGCVLPNASQFDVEQIGDLKNSVLNGCVYRTDETADYQDSDSMSSRTSSQASKESGIFSFMSSIYKSNVFQRSFGLIVAFISGVMMTGYSTTIFYSSPILVMVLSIFLLGERCGMFRIVAVSAMITGVVLIAKPPILFGSEDETYDAIGYSLSLSACVMSAWGVVLNKLVANDVDKPVILFYLGFACSACGLIGLFTLGQPSVGSYHDWIVGVAIGLLGLLTQFFLVWAVQLESPARVTIMRQMQIILGYIVQAVMFGVVPTWTDLLGAGLVLCTVIAMSFERTLMEKCSPTNVADDEATRPLISATVTEYGTTDTATAG